LRRRQLRERKWAKVSGFAYCTWSKALWHMCNAAMLRVCAAKGEPTYASSCLVCNNFRQATYQQHAQFNLVEEAKQGHLQLGSKKEQLVWMQQFARKKLCVRPTCSSSGIGASQSCKSAMLKLLFPWEACCCCRYTRLSISRVSRCKISCCSTPSVSAATGDTKSTRCTSCGGLCAAEIIFLCSTPA